MSSNYEPEKATTSSQSHGIFNQNMEETYILSVNIYGKGNPDREDRPTHWGIMIYKSWDTMGDIYHVRKNFDFYYNTQSRSVESTGLYGRSEVTQLSSSRRLEAHQILESYGNNDKHLPDVGQNCQDWVVGALGSLERANLVPKGTAGYWREQTGKGPISIGKQMIEDGKPWISNVKSTQRLPADATYGKTEKGRPIGKLNLDNFAHLSGVVTKR
ncbi:hypothetical protein AnigIFM50267_000424 [Aspergillus niger]|nr:hypothetical protein AnigIFM50267_000424 [Aspergillus niger]